MRDTALLRPIVNGMVHVDTLVHVMKHVIYMLDAEGKIEHDSPSWRQFTGSSVDEYFGMAWLQKLHPDDQAPFMTHWRGLIAEKREGVTEFRLWHHSGDWRWVHERTSPCFGDNGELAGWIGVTIDISERKRAEQLAKESMELAVRHAEEVELLYRRAPIGLTMFDLDLRYVRVSDGLAKMNQRSVEEHLGRTLSEIYPTGSRELEKLYREVIRTGVAIDRFEMDDGLMPGDDGQPMSRTYIGQIYPVKNADSDLVGIGAIWQDVTEQKRIENNQQLMNMELVHRTKNLITVIQAIASRSLMGDQPIEQARLSLLDRLQSISHAFSSLTETNWQGASLDAILRRSTQQYDEAIHMQGPDLQLNANTAQTFALVIHELVTNAAKYGALSVPAGHVALDWRVEQGDEGDRFLLSWREIGGPTVKMPERRGFGYTLLQRMMSNSDEYVATLDYAEDGLVYDLDVAIDVMLARSSNDQLFRASSPVDDSKARVELRLN